MSHWHRRLIILYLASIRNGARYRPTWIEMDLLDRPPVAAFEALSAIFGLTSCNRSCE